jgi:hypothetical protein
MKPKINNLELAEILLSKPSDIMRTLYQSNHVRRIIRKRREIKGSGRIISGASVFKK